MAVLPVDQDFHPTGCVTYPALQTETGCKPIDKWTKPNSLYYTFDRNMGLVDNYDRFDVLFNGNLVLSDMNQNRNYDPGCAAPHDLGRKAVSIPVTGNPGDNINVTLRLANLPDALYNTYVYVDDMHLRFE